MQQRKASGGQQPVAGRLESQLGIGGHASLQDCPVGDNAAEDLPDGLITVLLGKRQTTKAKNLKRTTAKIVKKKLVYYLYYYIILNIYFIYIFYLLFA